MLSDQRSLPPGFALEEASLSNWQKFREIRRTALRTDPQAFGQPFKQDAEGGADRWRRRLASRDRFLYGIDHVGSLVATAGTKHLSDGIWLLFGVYVAPEWRGRGLASALMESAFEGARRNGSRMMILSVNARQKEAIDLYKRFGFEISERGKGDPAADGVSYPELRMYRLIEG